MRVCGVAANVTHDAQLTVGRLQALLADKRGDGLGEVDAVDEDVRLDDLRVGSMALLGLCQVPLEDLGAADLLEQVDSAGATASQGTEDETAGLAAGNLLARGDVFLELGNQLVLIVVVAAAIGEGLETGQRLAVGVCELPGPSLSRVSSGRRMRRGVRRGCSFLNIP